MNIFRKVLIPSIIKLLKSLGIVLFLLFLFPNNSILARQKPIESVPFEMIGSYVVLKVKINESTPLNLILDTGIRNTLITELSPDDNISLNYSDVKELMGLGGGKQLGALKSNFNTLKIGKLKLSQKTVYVLDEDIFNLSMYTGSEINGLIGIDYFQNYIVEIDYSAKKIKFYDKNTSLKIRKGYKNLPLIIEGQKMFVLLTVVENNGMSKKVKMLLDTGAEVNAWFQTFNKNEAVQVPEKNIRGTIGQGLSGEISGKYGRISKICFADLCLDNAIVTFPDSASISEILNKSDRHGTIGSQILSRFNLIFDYGRKQLYFKPNENFKTKFNYNIAGLEIMQAIKTAQIAEVWLVWENSPAANAGVKVGDQIIEVNGVSTFQYTINEIKGLFVSPSKSPLELTLMRKGEKITVKLNMKSKL